MNIGRIIKGVGGNYYVSAKGKIYKCSARGKFRYYRKEKKYSSQT